MSPHDDNDRDDLVGVRPDTPADKSPANGAEAPADATESAQAAAFAELIDTVIAGSEPPAVMAAEQRALLETAAILRANLCSDPAAASGVSAVVGQVMGQVTGQVIEQVSGQGEGPAKGADDTHATGDSQPSASERDDGIIDFAARRRRRVRWLSVATAAVAAAVVLLFALRTPTPQRGPAQVESTLSMMHHSRPADPLIGEIPRERADRASDRLDTIYADRMAGYRDLRLRGGAR